MPLDQPVSFNRFGALCAFAAAATGFAYSTSFSLYLNDPSRGRRTRTRSSCSSAGSCRRRPSPRSTSGCARPTRRSRSGDTCWRSSRCLRRSAPRGLRPGQPREPAGVVADRRSELGRPARAGDVPAHGTGARGERLPDPARRTASARPRLHRVPLGRAARLRLHRPARHPRPEEAGLLAAAVFAGFVVNPIWFTWLGFVLWWTRSGAGAPASGSGRAVVRGSEAF